MPTTTGLTIPFTGLRKQYAALRNEILDATDEVLRSGKLMNGNNIAEFEHWLAQKNHVKYAITCHSGTQALEIIAEYWAKQISHRPPRVLLPSYTYVATANAFIRAGWDLYFIDTDVYGIMDEKKIPQLVSYDAVILVGLNGARIRDLWHDRVSRPWNDTILIEDAAQHWLADNCARVGHAAAISFDPMKNLGNYGNGGAVVTDDFELAQFARGWRYNGKPNHQVAGTNSCMSEIDCAQMLIKARHIDAWQQRRTKISNFWRERFKDLPLRCLIDEHNERGHAIHKFVIDVNSRDQLQQQLSQRKIETRVHYDRPLHEIDIFSRYPGPDMMAVCSSLTRRVLSLPMYPELTDLEVEYISDQVISLVS